MKDLIEELRSLPWFDVIGDLGEKAATVIEHLQAENERLGRELFENSILLEAHRQTKERLDKVIRAADLLADEVRCEEKHGLLVSDAAMHYFIERQALAALKAQATSESTAPE